MAKTNNSRAVNIKMARNRRQFALDRPELRLNTEARAPTAAPTAFPMKATDPAIRKMIDEAIAKRNQG